MTDIKPVALLPCCEYADSSAVKWNEFNGVVQCHNCGQVYTPTPPESAEQRNAALVAENEGLKKDAERYRFFKAHLHQPHAITHFVRFNNWHPSDAEYLADLDAAIDAAIKEQEKCS